MEIVIGAIGSLLAVVIVSTVQSTVRALQVRKVNRVFPIARNYVTVVFAGWTDVRPHYQYDMFVHSEAVHAVNRLSKLFAQYKTICHYEVLDELRNDKTSDIEICIGGPRSNRLTRAYLEQFCPGLNKLDDGILPDNTAMLVKLKVQASPHAVYKSILLIYGRNPLDTYCAIDFFCEQFDDLLKFYFSRDNAAIRLNCMIVENVRKATLARDETEQYFPPVSQASNVPALNRPEDARS